MTDDSSGVSGQCGERSPVTSFGNREFCVLQHGRAGWHEGKTRIDVQHGPIPPLRWGLMVDSPPVSGVSVSNGQDSSEPVDLVVASKRIDAAHEWVSDLCLGRRRWQMRVPVDPSDSDVTISEALNYAEAMAVELAALPSKSGANGWFDSAPHLCNDPACPGRTDAPASSNLTGDTR